MLSEERIKLMTKMAAYEANEGKKNVAVSSYFRGDYMGAQVLVGAICGTIAFATIFAMYMFYDIENFMVNFYKMDIVEFATGVLKKYVIFLAIYMVISYFVALFKHNKAKKHIENYKTALKALYDNF